MTAVVVNAVLHCTRCVLCQSQDAHLNAEISCLAVGSVGQMFHGYILMNNYQLDLIEN